MVEEHESEDAPQVMAWTLFSTKKPTKHKLKQGYDMRSLVFQIQEAQLLQRTIREKHLKITTSAEN